MGAPENSSLPAVPLRGASRSQCRQLSQRKGGKRELGKGSHPRIGPGRPLRLRLVHTYGRPQGRQQMLLTTPSEHDSSPTSNSCQTTPNIVLTDVIKKWNFCGGLLIDASCFLDAVLFAEGRGPCGLGQIGGGNSRPPKNAAFRGQACHKNTQGRKCLVTVSSRKGSLDCLVKTIQATPMALFPGAEAWKVVTRSHAKGRLAWGTARPSKRDPNRSASLPHQGTRTGHVAPLAPSRS